MGETKLQSLNAVYIYILDSVYLFFLRAKPTYFLKYKHNWNKLDVDQCVLVASSDSESQTKEV